MLQRLIELLRTHRTVLLSIVGGVCLLTGVVLIVNYLQSIPPNTATASIEQLTDFVMSDRFSQMEDEQRQAFAEGLVRRYAEMTDEQRTAAEEQMAKYRQDNPDQVRDQMLRFWQDFMVREAEQYVAIDPEEREAYLRRRLAFWRLIAPRQNREREQHDQQTEAARWDEMLSPERQARAIAFFQEEILPRTTARDRALTTLLFSDIAQIMRADQR